MTIAFFAVLTILLGTVTVLLYVADLLGENLDGMLSFLSRRMGPGVTHIPEKTSKVSVLVLLTLTVLSALVTFTLIAFR